MKHRSAIFFCALKIGTRRHRGFLGAHLQFFKLTVSNWDEGKVCPGEAEPFEDRDSCLVFAARLPPRTALVVIPVRHIFSSQINLQAKTGTNRVRIAITAQIPPLFSTSPGGIAGLIPLGAVARRQNGKNPVHLHKQGLKIGLRLGFPAIPLRQQKRAPRRPSFHKPGNPGQKIQKLRKNPLTVLS